MKTELTIILNTHMPYVLGKDALFSEPENWLFEAITETYIPLFSILSQWRAEQFEGKKIILSMTPCLVEQLLHCRERYIQYLEILHKIAQFEVERSQNKSLFNQYQKNPQDLSSEQLNLLNKSSQAYVQRINQALKFMADHDLMDFLKKLLTNKLTHVELWTSSPNHNFLPFFKQQTSDHFVQRGVELFENTFDRKPDGFWLPECAYMPGVENSLLKAGISKTAMALNAIEPYHSNLKSGIYQYNDLQVLIHDFRIAMNIWQAPSDTLPSNPVYREFYRDIGHDVRPEYFDNLGIVLPKQNGQTKAVWTGIKHFAGSGSEIPLGAKRIYDIDAARQQARQDVPTFLSILDNSRDLVYDQKNFILAFDTELFGHWWHEGLWWLENLLQYDLNEKGA